MRDESLERRSFLRLFISGIAIGAVGCVDNTIGGAYWPGNVRLVDGAVPPADGSYVPPADGAVIPQNDGSVPPQLDGSVTPQDAGVTPTPDAAVDPCADAGTITMYDLYAQALYFDGTEGPTTGTIYASQVEAGATIEMEFWHGHGGQNHRFAVTTENFAALKRGERVMIETTEVESHTHLLFIDPTDPNYRVPGSSPTEIRNC